MGGARFPRVKVWAQEEVLYHDELNAEFQNILDHFNPDGIDDASATSGEMQSQVDPSPEGTPSQAESLRGEIERIRFMLAAITGNTYWFEAPVRSIEDINNAIIALQTGQWLYEPASPTYIGANSFSLAGDKTADYMKGTRIRATLDGGDIYGTAINVEVAGTPAVTTITVKWDSGSLDSSLSVVKRGIISPALSSMAIKPPKVLASDYTVGPDDHAATLIANSASPITFTFGPASNTPPGWHVDVVNYGAGTLTLSCTVDGVATPTIITGRRTRILSNGSLYTGRLLTKADIGLGNVDNTADAIKHVAYAADADIPDGYVNGNKLLPLEAGTGLTLAVHAGPVGGEVTSTSWVKKYQYIMRRKGTVRVSFTIETSSVLYPADARLQKNGVTITEVSSNENGVGFGKATKTVNVPVSSGDELSFLISAYGYGRNAILRDVSITCKEDPYIGFAEVY